MKVKILSEYENKLLDRKDLVVEIDHENQPTPKKSELEQKLAEHFKTDKNKIDIIYIFSLPGTNSSKVKLKILNKPKEEKHEAQTNKEMGDNQGSE
ncbi:MAG: hypothetical protein QXM68_02075 [Candidatus Aenigmatarchaeota archaeon]|nr:hypothetical protein [Candidatus Aenigmarchaeota archaeon]